jgi:hypothetical protein
MSFNPYNLLRRTFLVVAAAAAIASTPALAQQIKKSEDGTVLCGAYTGIAVAPNGGIAITGCGGSTTPAGTPAGTFTISAANTTALPWNVTSPSTGVAATFTVTRSNGTSGPVTLPFTRDGGCGPLPLQDSVAFTDGQTTATLTVRTPNNDATCTFTLGNPTAGSGSTASSAPVLGTAYRAYVLVGVGAGVPSWATTTPPPPPTGAFNCPTPDPINTTSNFSLTYGGGLNGSLSMNSGQIGYTALPAFSSSGGPAQGESGKIGVNIGTNSPKSGTVEVSINHCPGVIDTAGAYVQGTTGGKCYQSFPIDQSEHDQFWFEAISPRGATTMDTWANAYSICEAYSSNGPWYVNVRYNFPDGGAHNMVWQWQFGYYNP